MTTMVVCRVEGTNICSIPNCHQQFGDGDTVCGGGHEIGQEYPIDFPSPTTELPVQQPADRSTASVECYADGNNCSICHQMFPEADDTCPTGHTIGQFYTK
ncbi:MAG: hypothetical protein HZC01_03000 [Candidatus Kerfeldbacteria bacterium]|nr:hypothetical protein [Candidatus Kerfeldbacteria bacterium]